MSCLGCTKRHPGCHSTCDSYKEFKKEKEKKKQYMYNPLDGYDREVSYRLKKYIFQGKSFKV